MHSFAQVGCVAGGALATFLMAQVTPLPDPSHGATLHEAVSIPADTQPIPTPTTDAQLIELITEQSLSRQLSVSTDAAKQRALTIGQFGFPSTSNLRFFDSFCASVNFATSTPNWSGECVSAQDLAPNAEVDRKHCPPFCEEESVPSTFRSRLSDYKRSGLSRGHLAPAGNYQSVQSHKDATFNLSANVVPQEMSMNGCDWLRLERFVKQLIASDDNDIERCWIFSGPVFRPTIGAKYSGERMFSKIVKVESESNWNRILVEKAVEVSEVTKVFNAPSNDGRMKGKMRFDTIGPSMVHVPTHLFKVVLAESVYVPTENDNERYHLAAFMMQNEPIAEKLPITEYLVDVEELERFVGLRFFPKLRGNAEVSLPELCLKYRCEYDDDERSSGWRGYGDIKGAASLDVLENAYLTSLDKGFDKDWMHSMYAREYRWRKRNLARDLQRKINGMRQFQ